VPRIRRTGTRATRHGHRKFREQSHDGKLHCQGQYRLKIATRSPQSPKLAQTSLRIC